MASMREIKRRRNSIRSTEQMTKAMKLVATVRLQKAREKAEQGRPYMDFLRQTVFSMLSKAKDVRHPYLMGREKGKSAVILITSNRGLAGGYNHNVTRLVEESGIPREEMLVYAIGQKGREELARKGFPVVWEKPEMISEPCYQDARDLAGQLLKDYAEGKIGQIFLAYTSFKNTVSHIPKLVRLLPIEPPEEAVDPGKQALMNFEPDEETVLEAVVPKYVSGLIYGALQEASASENGARMTAMDSASGNAEEMMEELGLAYNRARQSSITQELTEIIAGANAIGG